MTQLHLDTHYSQQQNEKKHYSVYFHLLFGGIVLITLLSLGVIFGKTILQIVRFFPIFSCAFTVCLVVGVLYYFYKVFVFGSNLSISEKIDYLRTKHIDKNTDFFNFLQIIIGIVGISTVISAIFNIADFSKRNLINSEQLLSDHHQMLIHPLYIILICLTGITCLLILSLRIKEIASELYHDYHIVLNNNKQNPQSLLKSHNGDSMSDIPKNSHVNLMSSDIRTDAEHDNEAPFLLPNYDNGFFYKKLFEINDNVQHLKRHIIVAKNDNINDTIIHQLWDNKISPFLNTLSERIKTLEDKFETYYTSKNASLIVPDDLKSKIFPDVINDDVPNNTLVHHVADVKETITPSATLIDTLDEFITDTAEATNTLEKKDLMAHNKTTPEAQSIILRSDLLPQEDEDEEETFAYLNNDTYTSRVIVPNRDTQMDIKEKTLDELSKFLEAKMKELYDNDFTKKNHLKTEQPV